MGLIDLVDVGLFGLVSLVVFFFFFFEVALVLLPVVAVGVVAGGGRRCLCRFGMWVCLIWWMGCGLLNFIIDLVDLGCEFV